MGCLYIITITKVSATIDLNDRLLRYGSPGNIALRENMVLRGSRPFPKFLIRETDEKRFSLGGYCEL